MSALPAIVEERDGRNMWCCPNCGKTMAEITSAGIVVIVFARGRMAGYQSAAGLALTCPKCWQVSALAEDAE